MFQKEIKDIMKADISEIDRGMAICNMPVMIKENNKLAKFFEMQAGVNAPYDEQDKKKMRKVDIKKFNYFYKLNCKITDIIIRYPIDFRQP